MLRGVPEERLGASYECPRCQNLFTLTAMTKPRNARRTLVSTNAEVQEPAVFEEGIPFKSSLAAAIEACQPAQPLTKKEDEPLPAGHRPLNPFGVLSFLFGTFALLFASISGLNLLVLPLASLGLVCGACALRTRAARKAGIKLPIAGLAVSLPVCGLAVYWLVSANRKDDIAGGPQTVYHFSRDGVQHVAPKETEWVDASKDAVQQAGMRVRVAAVEIKPVELKDSGGRTRLGDRCLVIKLRVSNMSVDRLVTYKSWGLASSGDEETAASLTDEQGRLYRLMSFRDAWTVAKQVPHASIPTAKWVDDLLVFEAPVGAVKYLRLELPAAAIGAMGKLQLEIPGGMVAFP
jgi:hypothetical protein